MVAEFATIVGLIGLYKQERSALKKQEHQDFIEWLEYHRHGDLKNLIVNNAALLTEVNHLIKADTELILSKIDDISDTLAKVAASIEEFRGLAGLMTHEPDLEPQTRELLRQLVQGGWKKFGVMPIRGRAEITIIHEGCQPIKTDSQYLEDDIDHLVAAGYLRDDSQFGSSQKFYSLTRRAAGLFVTRK